MMLRVMGYVAVLLALQYWIGLRPHWDGDPSTRRHGSARQTPRAVGLPQDLVLLELEPDRQTGFEDPAGQLGGIDLPECRAEQDRAAPR